MEFYNRGGDFRAHSAFNIARDRKLNRQHDLINLLTFYVRTAGDSSRLLETIPRRR